MQLVDSASENRASFLSVNSARRIVFFLVRLFFILVLFLRIVTVSALSLSLCTSLSLSRYLVIGLLSFSVSFHCSVSYP